MRDLPFNQVKTTKLMHCSVYLFSIDIKYFIIHKLFLYIFAQLPCGYNQTN